MSIEHSTIERIGAKEGIDETLEFPLRLSKICLLSIRDDNAFICPSAIEAAFHALVYADERSTYQLTKKLPLYFYNYFILDENSISSLSEDFHMQAIKYFYTEFQLHTLADSEQRKNILNGIFKDFSERVLVPIVPLPKVLGQIIVEPMTLVSCCSLVFRPLHSEYWEQLWSLKFQSNIHLAIETEFYFTKGFFRVAFHPTFHKIEIPGQIFHGIAMNLIILLPRCSSDLVHLHANIKEYLNLPYTSAFVGVCLPNISMDIEMNLVEALKTFDSLYNFDQFKEEISLSSARSLGHFSLDLSTNKTEQSTTHCLHSIDLSPVTPWVFFANRPFLFLITYGNSYLLIGQMLGPKIRRQPKEGLPQSKPNV